MGDSNKWTCVCGQINTGDFCEACGTSREEVVGKEERDQVKENLEEKGSKRKLSDYLAASDQSEPEVSRYEQIARKNGSAKQTDGTTSVTNESEPSPASNQESWDCSCGAKGNTGNFCANCGRPKELANEPVREQNTDQTIQITPIASTQNVRSEAPSPVPEKPHTNVPPSTPSPKSGKKKWILIGALGFVLCIFLGYMVASNGKKEPVKDFTQTVASDVKKDDNTRPVREMKTDLSLGGLDLGMSLDDMQKVMGKENSKKDSEDLKGLVFYKYDILRAGVIDNKVHSLVSDGSSAKTKRGLHEGSSYQDMIDAYGSDYTKMNYKDKTLYEYTFKTLNGEDGLLRFAINKSDNKVAYISVRIPEGDESTQKQTQPVDVAGAKQAFVNYHKAISQKHLDDAYGMMTPACQNHMGDLSSYASGYKDTLSSSVDNLTVVSSSSDQVVMNYRLIARDRYKGNKVKVQKFAGTVTMVKQNGSWKIGQTQSSKVDEYIENR